MPAPFILGWEEWLALPDLGVPAIKAKIDTGARTSALHAFHIEPFGPISAPLVRFTVHPVRRLDDIEIACAAPIVDRREVTSSNGERELRYVILTRVAIGGREWPIEVTLTNRESMSYRMLLGRQAIQEDMYVDPASSFRQPKLSAKPYRKLPRQPAVHRPLRIAILTRRPGASAPVRLAAAATERGHVVETIDLTRLSLGFDGAEPMLCLDGDRPVPHFDAVIPRIGVRGGREASVFERAVLRQLELMGSFTPIRADILERLSEPLALRQTLLRHGIESHGPSRIGEADIGTALDNAPDARHVSMLVIGRRALADRPSADAFATPADNATAQDLALRIAAALQLRLVAIDFVSVGGTLRFAGIDTSPPLSRYSRAGGEDAGALIIADVEGAARSWRRLPPPTPAAIVTDADADGAGG